MRALSEAVEETDPADWAADELSEAARAKEGVMCRAPPGVFARARQNLSAMVGQGHRGAPTGTSEQTMIRAFTII